MNGISCPTVSLCVVVDGAGNVLASSDPTGGASAWSVSHIDNTVYYECGHYDTSPCQPPLISVSCRSSSFCAAADDNGSVFTSTDPLAGQATTWKTEGITPESEFDGLSCPTDALCVGICPVGFGPGGACQGNSYSAGAVVTWNPAGGPPQFSTISATQLAGIWCPSASACFTSDSNGDVIDSATPTNGRSWLVGYANAPSTAAYRPLRGLACLTPSACIAISQTGDLLVGGPPLTRGQTKALLLAKLIPTGKSATLSSVLRHGGYSRSFTASGAGQVAVSWTAEIKHDSRRATALLVASASVSFTTSATRTIRIKLTRAGKHLLLGANGHLILTGKASFAAPGNPPTVATRRFVLKR